MKRNTLDIETRDAKRCDNARDELVEGGGALGLDLEPSIGAGGVGSLGLLEQFT